METTISLTILLPILDAQSKLADIVRTAMRFNCTCYHHCKLDDCANGNCFECTGPKSFCRLSKWNIRARREICSDRIEPGTRTYGKRMRFAVKREDARAKDALISRIRENRGGVFEIANDGPPKEGVPERGWCAHRERACIDDHDGLHCTRSPAINEM